MIALGKIVKVRSNKGEVVISPLLDIDISSLEAGELLVLKSSRYEKRFTTQYAREIKGSVVIKLTGVDTINQALKLVGYSVFMPGAEVDEPQESDILGFQVVDISGESWGKVVNLESDSLNPVMEIQGAEGIIYVPYNDTIITAVNKNEKTLVIDPPAGLKELNR